MSDDEERPNALKAHVPFIKDDDDPEPFVTEKCKKGDHSCDSYICGCPCHD